MIDNQVDSAYLDNFHGNEENNWYNFLVQLNNKNHDIVRTISKSKDLIPAIQSQHQYSIPTKSNKKNTILQQIHTINYLSYQ